jgi:alkanesulfonate monooxygenase SsuD/methylene tetrahydromethanopterin reductase-like flavin-dependent oxidoreductase (luciferase family)
VSQVSIYLDFRARPDTPPDAADFEDGIRLVQAADRLGFAHVWTTEQHGVDDGYLPAQLPMLAALARETTRIRLGAAVILLPLTHPRRVLEEACLVDVLSHGRLTLAWVIWASDDAERRWREVVGPAFGYQQRKYAEWEEDTPSAGGYAPAGDLDDLRRRVLIGRPAEITERLLGLREAYPFDEVVIWARLPGVPLDMALEHLEVIAAEVAPELAR